MVLSLHSTQGGMSKETATMYKRLAPFCQAKDQNRILGRSTGSEAGLDLLFSD